MTKEMIQFKDKGFGVMINFWNSWSSPILTNKSWVVNFKEGKITPIKDTKDL